MAITVNLQNNPTPANVGRTVANAVLINSGFSGGTTTYEIRRFDQQPINMTKGTIISVASNTTATLNDIPAITAAQLQIVLPHRIRYQVRVKSGSGAWTGWTTFTTRDKKYSTPGEVSQITDDSKDTWPARGPVTINVTNSAKATVVTTARGATVTNTAQSYVTTSGITFTARGATVTNTE